MDNKKEIVIFIAAILAISVFAVMPVVAKTPHSGSTLVNLENNVVNWTTLETDENGYFYMGFYDYEYPVDTLYSISWVAPSYVRYNIGASEYLIGESGSYWGGSDREYDVTMHATSIEDTPEREIAKAVIQENATNSPSGSKNIEVSCELELLDDNRYFLATYKICNIGNNTLTNVKFYVYNDLDVGGSWGNDIAYYDSSTDTFYQVDQVNNYVCGFRPVVHSTHHNLSDWWGGQMDAIANDVLVDNNKYPDTGTDDCGMVVEWDVGTLNPGDCVEYPVYFCVSDTSVADFMSCFPAPTPVPTLTPIGLIALAGLLSTIAAMSIKMRRRRG